MNAVALQQPSDTREEEQQQEESREEDAVQKVWEMKREIITSIDDENGFWL